MTTNETTTPTDQILAALPPLELSQDFIASAGIIGIDASGSRMWEAGVDANGIPIVSLITTTTDIGERERRIIARRMIALWTIFGGTNPKGASK